MERGKTGYVQGWGLAVLGQAQPGALPIRAWGEPRVAGEAWGRAVPGSAVPPPGTAVVRFGCVPVCL